MRIVLDTNIYISAAIKSEYAESIIQLAVKTGRVVQIITSEEILDELREKLLKILECALAGRADLIVSADKHLIKLKNFQGISIIHPKTLTWILPEYFKKFAKSKKN